MSREFRFTNGAEFAKAADGAPGVWAQMIWVPHPELKQVQSVEFHTPPPAMQACCCAGSQAAVQLQALQSHVPPLFRHAAWALGSGQELMVEHCPGLLPATPRQNWRSLALLMLEHCVASCVAMPLQSARVSGSATVLQLGVTGLPPLEMP